MELAFQIVGWAWVGWAGLNLLLFLATAAFVRPNQPCFNGFRIVMPAWTRRVLTPEEYAAVVAHERGHRRHMHVWANLLLTCCCMQASSERRLRQEWQADDYAARQGHAAALATALEKVSKHPIDRRRAARLRYMYT